jgi:hypothetical protein
MITMLFAATIPDADPLAMPAPPWLLWALLMLTFTLHVIAMNFVLGGSIIAAFARLRGSDNGMRMAKSFGKAMPTAVAAAVTLGVAPLLFLQALYGRLFFASAVLVAWFWLAIVPVLIFAYYGTYWIAFRGKKEGSGRFAVLALLVALALLGIAFVQSTNMSLMLRPESFLTKYAADGGGTHLNLGDPTFIPRWLHMLLGALAVGGYAVSLYGVIQRKTDQEHGTWAARWGALWFVAPTAANLLTGLWWIGVLPREVILRFMGRDVLASLSLGLGIVFGFVTLGMMLMAMGSADPTRQVKHAGYTLVATLVAMVLARDGVRQGMLGEAGFSPTTWVDPQWGVIAIFIVLLVGALAVTAWMASLLLRTKPQA